MLEATKIKATRDSRRGAGGCASSVDDTRQADTRRALSLRCVLHSLAVPSSTFRSVCCVTNFVTTKLELTLSSYTTKTLSSYTVLDAVRPTTKTLYRYTVLVPWSAAGAASS
jgi:hypothetical protein